jgi:hypothetical protein
MKNTQQLHTLFALSNLWMMRGRRARPLHERKSRPRGQAEAALHTIAAATAAQVETTEKGRERKFEAAALVGRRTSKFAPSTCENRKPDAASL